MAARLRWFRCLLSATPGFSDLLDRDHFVASSPREALGRAKKRWWDTPGFYVVARELDMNGKETGACAQGRVSKNGYVADTAPKKLFMLGLHPAEQDGVWVATVWPFIAVVVREEDGEFYGSLKGCSDRAVIDTVSSSTPEGAAEMLNERAGVLARGLLRLAQHIPLSEQRDQRPDRDEDGDEQ